MEVTAAAQNQCWPIFVNDYISSLKMLPIPEMAGTVITGAEMKVSYLVDHSYVPAVDASTDNLGIWNSRHRSTTTRTFLVKGSEFGMDDECEFIVRKRMYNHVNATPSGGVRKVVWTLYRTDGIAFRSLVSYHIAKGAEVIETTHGNAKRIKQVYKRTYPSAIRRMKELRRTLAPREVLPVMVAEQSGVLGASDTQGLPRNKTQLYSMSRSKVPTSMKCGVTSNDTLMEGLFKLSESAVEWNNLNSSLEERREDPTSTAFVQNCSSTSSLSYVEVKADESDVPLLNRSNDVGASNQNHMTSSEFKTQLVDRLSRIPCEQRGEIRAKLEHELDVMFADKITAEVEQIFDDSSRANVMERLLEMVNH
ncbi:unnamed protein product [Toxocara canis]|uniref:SAWADEE domain-containing protein n=1 Tax=Toxocara canis TaxID=6265 RepID=A0A183UXF1_TOXCA|nr:unnamed protein product [Toxocara canis]